MAEQEFTIYNVPVTICLLISSASIHTGTWASSPATLGAKRRFRSEDGERKLAEMTIFADRCCPCGEVKAKKEYQEGGDLSAPYGAPLISHPSSLLCHCRFRGIAGEVSVPRETGEPKGVKTSPLDAR